MNARFAVFARAWALAVWLGLASQEMATSPLRLRIAVTYTADGHTFRFDRAGDDPRARHTWLAHVVLAAPAPLREGPVDCGRKRPPR